MAVPHLSNDKDVEELPDCSDLEAIGVSSAWKERSLRGGSTPTSNDAIEGVTNNGVQNAASSDHKEASL